MDRLDEHIWLNILQQVAECTVLQEFKNVIIAVMNRECDDLDTRMCLLQLFRYIQSRQPRHINVKQKDVRFEHECSRQRLLSVLCFTENSVHA